MKKSTKLKFGKLPKSLRRELHKLDRHPAPKFNMDNTVPRPRVIYRNGVAVPYEGP